MISTNWTISGGPNDGQSITISGGPNDGQEIEFTVNGVESDLSFTTDSSIFDIAAEFIIPPNVLIFKKRYNITIAIDKFKINLS